MNPMVSDDNRWMRAALLQARFGLGRVWPNPSVGCIIVKDGLLVGQGRTADGGRPHAETEALKAAGPFAHDATAYVTLEPCSHHGKTPPCADALIKAGIKRVVISVDDPDKNVSGAGINRLIEAGVEVKTGVESETVTEFYRAYLHHRRSARPFVSVKIASTLDGKIALADGRSKWITGERTRGYVHLLRSGHDAILTASGTVRADDPTLTCRLDAYNGPQPIRIVVSSEIALKASSALAQTCSESRVIIAGVVNEGNLPKGVEALPVDIDQDGKPDLNDTIIKLGEIGVTSVMVEAGGTFIASLFKAGLVDRLIWTRSSSVIGADGLSSLGQLNLEDLSDGRMFLPQSSFRIDDDMIEIFTRQAYLS